MIQEAIERIRKMEQYYDALIKAEKDNPGALRQDTELQEMLRHVLQYYEGGQWVRDYELDEQGLLPETLKRGVLSEDGVYNFLTGL